MVIGMWYHLLLDQFDVYYHFITGILCQSATAIVSSGDRYFCHLFNDELCHLLNNLWYDLVNDL